MADGTEIEWTDATWNPVTGCSVVSPGCTHCYAMKLAGGRLMHTPSRQGLTEASKAGPVWNGQVRFNEGWLDQPLRWTRARKIFVCAHGDLFHENVPDGWIDRVFAVMALAPQHTFQVLTKRAKRMREYFSKPLQGPWAGRAFRDGQPSTDADWRVRSTVTDMLPTTSADALNRACAFMDKRDGGEGDGFFRRWPLPNVWLGVSAEDQQRADERVPDLLATPAAVRFVSAEPLLGSIDFMDIPWPNDRPRFPETDDISDGRSALHAVEGSRLDWIIVGGESGQRARPMHPAWARSIRDQCAAAGVPFFFKQWGVWQVHHPSPGGDLGGDMRADLVRFVQRDREPDGHFRKGDVMMARVGKKAAGHLLDGVEHHAFPEAR